MDYRGLTEEQRTFVECIEQHLGEFAAVSVACVLTGEMRRFAVVTPLEVSLIYDFAAMYPGIGEQLRNNTKTG